MDKPFNLNETPLLPSFDPERVSQLPVRIDNPLLAKEIIFLVTTQCNIECTYCYNFYTQKHIHMSPELALSFLKNYLKIQKSFPESPHFYQFIFSGGEPTINSDTIFAVMDYVNSEGIDCIPTLLTNGVMSTTLLKKFIDQKFLFQLSYDGGDNLYRKTLSNKSIDKHIHHTFKEVADAGGAIVLRATVTQSNVAELPEIIRYAKKYNVCAVIFDTNDNIGNALKYGVQRADKDQYVHYYFEALKVAQENQIDIIVPEIMRLKNKGDYQQLTKISLLPDGTLTTSTKYLSRYAKGADKGVIGKYSIENGFEIDKDNINRMVNNVLANLDIHCKSCECFTYCRGRNPNLQLFREEIARQKDEYRCDITRDIYRRLKSDPSIINRMGSKGELE